MKWRTGFLAISGCGLALGLVTSSAFGAGTQFGLPNPTRTPGSTSSAVTQGNINSTICVSGYTKTVRPPVRYTNKLKVQQLASGYAIDGRTSAKSYEEDHLIPLEVGGNPRKHANLWPEPWWGQWNATAKDRLENKAHSLVCGGKLSLADAQALFTGNWKASYKKLIGTPNPTTTTTVHPPPPTCYPKTSGGNCYSVGQYCPAADHGVSGVSKNGTPMICRLVGSSWRWTAT